jgi:hypothetical protein
VHAGAALDGDGEPGADQGGHDLREHRDPAFAGQDLGGDDDSHRANLHRPGDTAL